ERPSPSRLLVVDVGDAGIRLDLRHLPIARGVRLPVLRIPTKAVHVFTASEITKDKGAYFAVPVVMPHIILIIGTILVAFEEGKRRIEIHWWERYTDVARRIRPAFWVRNVCGGFELDTIIRSIVPFAILRNTERPDSAAIHRLNLHRIGILVRRPIMGIGRAIKVLICP